MPPKITLSKPTKPTGPPKPKKALTNFAAESESDSEPDTLTSKSKSKSKPKSATAASKAHVNAQLAAAASTTTSTTTTTAAAAPSLDPTIYDYDTAWESMSALSRERAAVAAADSAERKPKYMASLLSAAEVRKRDALRAKERALLKEREAEGDEFADKETFVTEAYKRQQAELAAQEAEEAAREERERKKRGEAGGMTGFYRGVLERGEARHGALVDAAGAAPVVVEQQKEERKEKKKEKTLAELAKERGAEVNEEGIVVDKTQLLTGGLNVSSGPRGGSTATAARGSGERRPQYQGVGGRREDARARQSRMVEEQLAAAQKRALEAEEEERKNLERAAKSRKTESDVMGAKERYLQRKREAEEAKRKAQGA